MSEKEYICLGSDQTFTEDEVYTCTCGKNICPTCGGEVQTIEEYDKAMKENNYDDKRP